MKTMYIAADFSKGQSVFDNIEARIKEIPVGILGKYGIKMTERSSIQKLICS